MECWWLPFFQLMIFRTIMALFFRCLLWLRANVYLKTKCMYLKTKHIYLKTKSIGQTASGNNQPWTTTKAVANCERKTGKGTIPIYLIKQIRYGSKEEVTRSLTTHNSQRKIHRRHSGYWCQVYWKPSASHTQSASPPITLILVLIHHHAVTICF